MKWEQNISRCEEKWAWLSLKNIKKGFRKISFCSFFGTFVLFTSFICFMILMPYINEVYYHLSFSWWGTLLTLVLSCQPELKQTDLEVNWYDSSRLHLLTPSLRECREAFRRWPLTFHWFHHMSLGTENWLLTNYISAAGWIEIRMQCGGKKAMKLRDKRAYKMQDRVNGWNNKLLTEPKINDKCSINTAWQEEWTVFFQAAISESK